MCFINKEIKNVADFISKINDLYGNHFQSKKHLFFRGHSDIDYKLLPGVLRGGYNEKEILLDFKQYAPFHKIDYDFINERERILVDMQHNEIPTRLLDWTVAPLNALFFCCSEKNEDDNSGTDGQIFMFDPWEYNKRLINDYGKHKEIHQIHITARALLSGGWKFDEINEYVNKRFSYQGLFPEDIKHPFAFVANFTNDRILLQRGVFTIHGESNDEFRPDLFMKRIIIKKEFKRKILDELNKLYVNDYSIYPDFAGMKNLIINRKGLFNL